MSYNFPVKMFVISSKDGALKSFWKSFESSTYIPKDLDYSFLCASSSKELNQIFKEIENIEVDYKEPNWSMFIFLTDIESIQKYAVKMKLTRKEPTIVMRWWDILPNLEKTYKNRLLYNRYTGINLMPTKELYNTNAQVKGILRLDNPVLLDEVELLGDDASLKMMRHTLLGLTQPKRKDIFGNSKNSYGHIRLTVATHFYINQDNIETITTLLETYANYSKELLKHIQFVIVDDGSPIDYEIPKFDLNLTWIKIDRDIRWNQAGAKNLCMLYARSNNVVISDVDHIFPEHTLKWLSSRNISHRRFYKVYRKLSNGKIIKGHSNLFYLSRARWFELFGMDEEFSGAYGAEDFRFVKNFKNHGTIQSYIPKKYYCQIRDLDRDKSYHSLVRDLSFNTSVDTRKRMEADYFGADYGHSRSMFNYTWHILVDYETSSAVIPIIDRTWRPRWWFRQLASYICSC